jgi:hypothetical protein
VAGDVTIATNSWVYPHSQPTNGGSVHFDVAGFYVHAGGGVNATERGHRGGYQDEWGYGPGGSQGTTGRGPGGAGYGGKGGDSRSTVGGPTYGSSNAPVHAGSGAGGVRAYHDTRDYGSNGGGLIRVTAADSVIVDGSLLADGGNKVNAYPGCGSGGGIYVACRSFSGSGLLSAKGGSNTRSSNDAGGAGGGGRIAVCYTRSTNGWRGVAQADGGTCGYTAYNADDGTVVFWKPPPRGTLLVIQ